MVRVDRGDAHEERLFTRRFVLLGISELAYFTSVGVAIYALPLYATGPVGSDEAGAGLAYGAFGVTALLSRPFAGRLSDQRGRIPLMMVGAVLAGVGMALLPFTHSLGVVVAVRLMQGIGEAAFYVAGFAMLADLAPPSRMGEALSYNSLGLYLGIALGPPLGEALLEAGGFDAAWYGAAVLAGLAMVLAVAIGEPEHEQDVGHGALIHRPAIPISLGFCSSLAAMGGFLAFATLYSEDLGMGNASVTLLIYGGTVVVSRVVFARVPDRLPSLPLGAMSLAAVGTGLLIAAGWRTPEGLILGSVVMALGITFSTPAFFSAIFGTARPSERGAAAGTATAFMDIGLSFGPIALGVVANAGGIPWAFAAAAGIAWAGAVWTAFLARSRTASPTVR